MVAIPLLEEAAGSASGPMIASIAGVDTQAADWTQCEIHNTTGLKRTLAIYPASAGFDLVEELDFLSARTVEPNVFFNPHFLAPAMPRLEDREVRLAVIRDGDEHRSRLRLLVPFSIEHSSVALGQPVIRTWSHPFGPLGTPLLDRDDPENVLESFFSILAKPHLKLPKVLVLPNMMLDGTASSIIRLAAHKRGLPVVTTGETERPFLKSQLDGDAYLRQSLTPHHYRGFGRLKRRLCERGVLEYRIDRSVEDVRVGLENFLSLEASGWKGRQRTAMVIDRYRAAFAREAVNRLSQEDMCRVHSLILDGKTIASLIVFIEAGTAYTWKTAYDESLAAYSPGALLMVEVTKQHLEDPNIMMTNSCTVPDHPVMSRLWRERRPIGAMVIGLTADSDKSARQAAQQLNRHRETRNAARIIRNRIRNMLRRR